MKTLLISAILFLALGSAASAYTPTAQQCADAGGYLNTATQGCDVRPASPVFIFTAAPATRNIQAVPGVTYQVNTGDTVSYSGTIVYVTSPGTVTFCPCPNWE